MAKADEPISFAGTHFAAIENTGGAAFRLADGDQLDGAEASFLRFLEQARGNAMQRAGFVEIRGEVVGPGRSVIIIGCGQDNFLNQARNAGEFFVVECFGNVLGGVVDVALAGGEEEKGDFAVAEGPVIATGADQVDS